VREGGVSSGGVGVGGVGWGVGGGGGGGSGNEAKLNGNRECVQSYRSLWTSG